MMDVVVCLLIIQPTTATLCGRLLSLSLPLASSRLAQVEELRSWLLLSRRPHASIIFFDRNRRRDDVDWLCRCRTRNSLTLTI